MAEPIPFEEANLLLVGADEDWTVQPLPVLRTRDHVISCWRLSAADLRRIAETGEVWLSVRGTNSPPVLVTGLKEAVIDG